MKKKNIYLIIVLAIVLPIGFNFLQLAIPWTLPKSFVGNWSSKQKVTVRFHHNNKYDFKTSIDAVDINLTISETGSVSGNIGNAVFKDCSVTKNTGWMSKFKNFSTDFMISGKIAGAIFPDDTIAEIGIRFPFFKTTDTKIKATIYESKGWDIFPMADVNLEKQK